MKLMLTVSAIAAAPAVQAQAETDGASLGNEIIVTAARREMSLQDTPLAVDVVTGEAIQKLNIFDVRDVSNLAPGLELTNSSGRNNVATLRGITFDPDSGSAAAVDIFFNEVPSDAQTMFTAIYDVGQIEVLRGPQGLFRGRTSPGGSILIGTARPDLDRATGYMQGSLTTRDAYNVQGAASLPIVEGKLALRAALLADRNAQSNVRTLDGRDARQTTMSGRLSLAYNSGTGFRADLTYQHLYSDTRAYEVAFGSGAQATPISPVLSGPVLTPSDRISVTEGTNRFQNLTNFVTLNSSYEFGAAELVFNGGYQNSKLTQQRDLDIPNAIPDYTLDQALETRYEVTNGEIRLQSRGDSRLNWALAGNYSHQTNTVAVDAVQDQLFGFSGFPLLPTNPVTGFGPTGSLLPVDANYLPVRAFVDVGIKSDTYGLAGTVGYEVVDGLTITGGLRHTWANVDRAQTPRIALLGGPAGAPTVSPRESIRARAFTGGANISWQIDPDLTAYASYNRSFRQGVFAVGVSVPVDPALLRTPNETSNGYEIGIKSFLFDRLISFNLTGFYQKFNNYIAFAPAIYTNSDRSGAVDSTASSLPISGDAMTKGIEAQLGIHPSRNMDFSVNAAYTKARWDNAEVLCNDFNGDGRPDADGTPAVQPGKQASTCVRNDRLSRTPDFSLTANGEIRFPVGNAEPFIRTLVNYRPGFYFQNDNYDYRAFTRVDLFAGVRLPNSGWEVTAFVKNLLDQDRVLAASQGIGRAGTTDPTASFNSGYRSGVVTAPREFGATLRYAW